MTERIFVRITVALRSANLGSPVQGELAFRLVLQAEKTEGLYRRPMIAFTPNFDSKIKSVRFAAEPPRLPLRRELSDCIKDLSSTTEGEITRGRCLHHSVDAHQVKKRSFAFALVHIKCFRTCSLYLSFRHGALSFSLKEKAPLRALLFALYLRSQSWWRCRFRRPHRHGMYRNLFRYIRRSRVRRRFPAERLRAHPCRWAGGRSSR